MVKAKWSRCMTRAESIVPTTLAEVRPHSRNPFVAEYSCKQAIPILSRAPAAHPKHDRKSWTGEDRLEEHRTGGASASGLGLFSTVTLRAVSVYKSARSTPKSRACPC